MEEGKEEQVWPDSLWSSEAGMCAVTVGTKNVQDPSVHLRCLFSICIICIIFILFFKSQNPRMVWVGRDLTDHLIVPPPMGRDAFHRAECY